ncbi:MAG: IS30 family transposase [Acidimicrobiia bacterium]|nr:IS30 family transposase [Acidimicrobiia bacterium]
MFRAPRVARPDRLTLADRVEIQLGLERDESTPQIAARIGFHRTSVWREIARNGGRDGYRAVEADQRAVEQARRPKQAKLSDPRLARYVIEKLEQLWSPEEIAARIRVDHPHDPAMRISHETIYRALFVQGRGELRRELHRCLRTGRARRRPQGRDSNVGRMSDMVSISDRPPEVEDRAVPGHWEGDLILGRDGRSQIGTLVERTTRYVLLLHLPGDRTAATVRAAMQAKIAQLPDTLARSITWDQGKEMAQHATFTVETGIPVYFCDPHSPWQRGSNENTNGLLRQFFPKGTDLSQHTQEDLDRAADLLNGRPRKTLNWQTPTEQLTQLVAATG